jgi:hypothetical protein
VPGVVTMWSVAMVVLSVVFGEVTVIDYDAC